jgi:sugar lactone lactonase YvrE
MTPRVEHLSKPSNLAFAGPDKRILYIGPVALSAH